MIYEMRTYRLKVGALPKYIEIVQNTGIQIQKRHLGNLVGYFYSDIGPLNQVVHIWAYNSLDDREARRALLAQDPEWQEFIPALQALVEEMENKILKAMPFSPLT